MRRGLIALAFALLLAAACRSQQISPPPIEWQRVFGGTENDLLSTVRQTADGGFLFGGSSESPAGGNKTATNQSAMDYWVVRTDTQGKWIWDRSFGGYSFDLFYDLRETVDGGTIIGGSSQSGVTGTKTTPHFGTAGSPDFWALLLDRFGQVVWERDFGGTYDDVLRKVQQTSDGGFMLAGESGSPVSGNKTATNFGSGDFWVVRLDADGNKLWDKSFGGAGNNGFGNDSLWDAQQTRDGGFILGGASVSPPSGNKTSPHFGNSPIAPDFWLVRVDADGNKLWDRSFGGTNDDTLYAVREMPDGGFMLAGRSNSSPGTGNKTSPNFGDWDFWVVRLDANGNKLWEQSFGGTEAEYPYSLDVTRDGGVIIGGWSASGVSGNKSSPGFGGADYWVVRLDADGNKLWEASYGGSRTDELQSLQQTRDGGFILGGWSSSPPDGNKTTAPFSNFFDYWVLKLGPEQPVLCLSGQPFGAGGLHLLLSGIKNLSYATEYSGDLNTWTALQTNRMSSGQLELIDSGMTNATQRFYRARQVQ